MPDFPETSIYNDNHIFSSFMFLSIRDVFGFWEFYNQTERRPKAPWWLPPPRQPPARSGCI